MSKKKLDHLGVSAFCESMAMMVHSGIQTDEAIALLQTEKQGSGGILEQGLAAAKEKIDEGATLYEALNASGIFPEYALDMINVGESERMHALYFKVLQDAVDDGINYAYTWMRTDNTRAHAFAGRYGLVDDKMRNFVFEKA